MTAQIEIALRPFKFTREEVGTIAQLTYRMKGLVGGKEPGWQLELVRYSMRLQKIINRAMARAWESE